MASSAALMSALTSASIGRVLVEGYSLISKMFILMVSEMMKTDCQ